MKSYICALIIECVVKIRFIHMFEVKLGRELIWLSVIPATSKCKLKLDDWLLYCTVSWTIILQSWLLLKFNQWKEWGNRILISRPCSKVIFFPSPFFLYLSQDFKLISLSGPQNMMFSLADVYLIFSSLGGVGEQVLGLIGFTLSMFSLAVICFEGVYLIGWERGSQYQVW